MTYIVVNKLRRYPPRPPENERTMLELVIFIVIYFVVVNFVLPRMGIQPG